MSGYILRTPLYFFHQLLFENYIEKLCSDFDSDKLFVVELGVKREFEKLKIDTLEDYFEFLLNQFRVKAFDKINSDFKLLTEPEKEQYLIDLSALLEMYKLRIINIEKNEWLKSQLNNELKLIKDYLAVNFSLIFEVIEIKKNTEEYFEDNTIEIPFKFLDSLVFGDGFDKLCDSFYYKTIHTKDYKLVSEHNKEFSFEAWLLKKDISEQLHFDTYVKKVIRHYIDDSLKIIDNSVISKTDSKSYLIDQLNILQSYFLKLEDFRQGKYNFLLEAIIFIVSTLNVKYGYLGIKHRLYREVLEEDDKPINTGFYPKNNLPKKFFNELYDITAYQLELIDDVEVSEDDFLNVFMFADSNSESKIQFRVFNPIAVYYLDQLESFFDNFNRVAIEKSGLFFNKQGKVFNQVDLNTASSRGTVKPVDKIKIDETFKNLKKKYLK
ncbi:hypothetical protein FCR2A7T_13360 [Flavobacterium cauense R2A-7]|uniref:Uncharacterized protein n=1 Tax=Flavobacterium cauense R2A-7 TaxID=1341154 RepID=V6RZN0_9FLAO|nr:hypothetical protein [Flavobacterium cauense]ESU19931.1 hypothetical protein FCR2A7T_13360 [Flavobacterium cauense R2A-7]KGO83737.1 hypothetical protein Q762_00355 [Flavobacterium cauense R2A-7]TWI12351.1 hypothetical protein IP98_01563 [Flavobacterium cauense R2A-7]